MMRIARAVNLVLALAATGWGGLAGTLRVPGEYPTIGAALNAASPGDVIEVTAGAYTEDLVITKDVVVRGEHSVAGGGAIGPKGVPFPWELETPVRIVGSGSGSETVLVKGDARVTLEFLTVSGGRAAAVAVEGEARLVLNTRRSSRAAAWAFGFRTRRAPRSIGASWPGTPRPGSSRWGPRRSRSTIPCSLATVGLPLSWTGRHEPRRPGPCSTGMSSGLTSARDGRWSGTACFGERGRGAGGRGALELRQCSISANGVGAIITSGPARLVLEGNLIAGNRGNYIPGPEEPNGNSQGGLCPGIPGYPWPEGLRDR